MTPVLLRWYYTQCLDPTFTSDHAPGGGSAMLLALWIISLITVYTYGLPAVEEAHLDQGIDLFYSSRRANCVPDLTTHLCYLCSVGSVFCWAWVFKNSYGHLDSQILKLFLNTLVHPWSNNKVLTALILIGTGCLAPFMIKRRSMPNATLTPNTVLQDQNKLKEVGTGSPFHTPQMIQREPSRHSSRRSEKGVFDDKGGGITVRMDLKAKTKKKRLRKPGKKKRKRTLSSSSSESSHKKRRKGKRKGEGKVKAKISINTDKSKDRDKTSSRKTRRKGRRRSPKTKGDVSSNTSRMSQREPSRRSSRRSEAPREGGSTRRKRRKKEKKKPSSNTKKRSQKKRSRSIESNTFPRSQRNKTNRKKARSTSSKSSKSYEKSTTGSRRKKPKTKGKKYKSNIKSAKKASKVNSSNEKTSKRSRKQKRSTSRKQKRSSSAKASKRLKKSPKSSSANGHRSSLQASRKTRLPPKKSINSKRRNKSPTASSTFVGQRFSVQKGQKKKRSKIPISKHPEINKRDGDVIRDSMNTARKRWLRTTESKRKRPLSRRASKGMAVYPPTTAASNDQILLPARANNFRSYETLLGRH